MIPLSNEQLHTLKRQGHYCLLLSVLFDIVTAALIITMTVRTPSWALFLEQHHISPWMWMASIVLCIIWAMVLLGIFAVRYLPHRQHVSTIHIQHLQEWRQSMPAIDAYLHTLAQWERTPSLHDYRVLQQLWKHR